MDDSGPQRLDVEEASEGFTEPWWRRWLGRKTDDGRDATISYGRGRVPLWTGRVVMDAC